MPWVMNSLAAGASVGASARQLMPVDATRMHGVTLHAHGRVLLRHMPHAATQNRICHDAAAQARIDVTTMQRC